jgi:hypothetical protein
MSTNQDCVNARLIRYEYGSIADYQLPEDVSLEKPYYLALVFIKGGREIKSIFPACNGMIDSSFLEFINKVVGKVEETESKLIYYFTDGTDIWFGN